MVRVRLVNADVPRGVTLHWHGMDVPNGDDGVAGVTQDAVLPGGEFVYRFRADQVGSFWYHSHQVADDQVRGGLFGALVVVPRGDLGRTVTDRRLRARAPLRRPAHRRRRRGRPRGSRPRRAASCACG